MTFRGFANWNEWSQERRKLEVALEQTTPGSAEWRKKMEQLMKFDSEHREENHHA